MDKKEELLKKAKILENKIKEEEKRIENITANIQEMKKKWQELRLMLN